MRVLLVSHLFPPQHTAGTEVYTLELGKRLSAAGHEASVFTTCKDVARPDLTQRTYTHEGLEVRELCSNLFLDTFRETWDRPAVDALFGTLLDELRPDVVHVHHLMYLSSGLLGEASRRGVPLVFTLHDFWFECPRFGQLLHADGSLCREVEFERCGTCLPSFAWRQGGLERRTAKALVQVRRWSGVDLAPWTKRVAALARGLGGSGRPTPEATSVPANEAAHYAAAARERSEVLKQRAAAVSRWIAPSRFLAERLIAWGLPTEHVHTLPTGVDRDGFRVERTPRPARVRVAFLGTLVPVKGAHVLLDAWSRLSPDLRARGELRLFGPRSHAPDYLARLETQAREVGAHFGGSVAREDVPGVLAATDLLVVPSVWFENRPLVVLEALCSATPLLVSEPGGMVELVEPGVHGWRFPLGDADALAQRLERVLEEPTSLDALYPEPVVPPTWESLLEGTLSLYEEARREVVRGERPA